MKIVVGTPYVEFLETCSPFDQKLGELVAELLPVIDLTEVVDEPEAWTFQGHLDEILKSDRVQIV